MLLAVNFRFFILLYSADQALSGSAEFHIAFEVLIGIESRSYCSHRLHTRLINGDAEA